MIQFVLLTVVAFVGMEIFSYAAHRFLFHGVLWRIHKTHHEANKSVFETNDVFSLLFACASIGLMISANSPLLDSIAFPLGLGIAVYGFTYFIIHDFFTHRRFLPFRSENKTLLTIRAAHQRHHQTAMKKGIEPFGLFLFDYIFFSRKVFSPQTKSAKDSSTFAPSAKN